MSDLLLRPASRDELPELCRRMASMEPWITLQLDAARLLEEHRKDSLRHGYVAESRGKVLGLILFRTHDAIPRLLQLGAEEILTRYHATSRENLPCGGYVHDLAVFPGSQGKGVGSALLDLAARDTLTAGSRLLYLCVSSFNTRAREFYDKSGFRFVGTIPDCVRVGWNEDLMVRPLNS